jgi:hypothetical protein
MTAVIIVIIVAYACFHVGAGHAHYRYRKAAGLRPSFMWSSARGPYATIRVPGTHFRLGHRL